MNNNTKPLFIIAFIAAALLSEMTSVAQSSSHTIGTVANRFERQVTNLHQEKIFIQTDRGSYITGETIWFSAYCVDAALHIPVDISKVLNIELLDMAGQAIKQDRIKLEDGFGEGQLFVSPDIRSGSYVLRAYTNWMKNFDPDFAFHKQITIVNPAAVKSNEDTSQIDNKAIIKFFPEGGDLVAALKSKVAVKATDQMGKGIPITGVVFDHEGNEVAQFTTSQLGYTFFPLTPVSGKSYIANVEWDSVIYRYEMPKVRQQGLVVRVTTTANDNVKIALSHSQGNHIYLIVHTRGVIKKLQKVDLKVEKEIIISRTELPPGISHISVMSENFDPLAERLVFKYPNLEQSLDLSIDNTEYNKRAKLNVSLKLSEKFLKNDLAQISISVSRSNGSNQFDDNIISNLLLTSDLKGQIEQPQSYFDQNNHLRAKQLDLIMLTNGWRRFNWSDIIGGDSVIIKYPAEINAPILSGRVEKDENGKLPRSLQLSFLGKTSIMNSLDLGSDGLFHFEVPYRVINEKAYFFVNGDTLLQDQINLYSPFDLNYSQKWKLTSNFDPESKSFLENLSTNIQISQVYRNFVHINGLQSELPGITTPFYGNPDRLYRLDDYTRFETVRDIFLEFIRTAVVRDNNRKSGFYVYNDKILPGAALTLIDGVPIYDANYILNFDPLKIEKISVVTDLYHMGSIAHQGVIDFTTYKGDFDGQELPEYMIEKVYLGLQRPREFYTPDYSLNKDLMKRIPDYRSTLYWNPQVDVNRESVTNVTFYTSDDAGLYEIKVNGITHSGIPIFGKHTFKVKDRTP